MITRIFQALALVLMLLPLSAEAADVTLQWDANTEADLAGYQVAVGVAPGNYAAVVDAGNRTSFQVRDLLPGRAYYFAVRAYNAEGLLSPYSAEVSTVTPSVATLSLNNIFATPASPRPVGSTIVFTGSATGGTGPYFYKWTIYGPRVAIVSGWSTSSSYIFRPTVAGTHYVTLWVRNAASVADAPENDASVKMIPFVVSCATTSTCK